MEALADTGFVVGVLLFLWAGWQSEKAAMRARQRRRRRLREASRHRL